MSELSLEARALLARVSSSDEPTRADRDRVMAMISGALVAGPAPLPPDAGLATAGVASAGLTKLVIAFVLSVGAGGVLTTAATSAWRGAHHPPTAPVVLAALPPLPPPAELPAILAAPVPEEAVEPAPAPPAAVPVRKPTPPAPIVERTPDVTRVPEAPAAPVARRDDACELAKELTVIQQAQQALKTEPARAIAALDAFAARCPAGVLLEERLATRALALCAGGQKAVGRVVAQDLGERFPASPSLERVTQACAP